MKSSKKQKRNNGEEIIIDPTKKEGTIIEAFFTGNNDVNDNNEIMKDVIFSFPNQYLTEIDFKVLKTVMMFDSASTINNLTDQTITEI